MAVLRACLTATGEFYACRSAGKGCLQPRGELYDPCPSCIKASPDETIEQLQARIERGDA